MNIGSTRKDYQNQKLIFDDINDPLIKFHQWYIGAQKKVSEPNAFALSTTNRNVPSSRMMLLKEYGETFVFYTNNSSKKGSDISQNKNASILFWWKEIHRQIRIDGKLKRIDKKRVEKYFYSRPIESQIGALISDQSKPIKSYDLLIDKYLTAIKKYKNKKIPFPKNWVGIELIPKKIEFWQGGESRIHQRLEFNKRGKKWHQKILSP